MDIVGDDDERDRFVDVDDDAVCLLDGAGDGWDDLGKGRRSLSLEGVPWPMAAIMVTVAN